MGAPVESTARLDQVRAMSARIRARQISPIPARKWLDREDMAALGRQAADPEDVEELVALAESFQARGADEARRWELMESDYRKEEGLGDEPLAETLTNQRRMIWILGAMCIIGI
jgi:hypothetical protein